MVSVYIINRYLTGGCIARRTVVAGTMSASI